MIWEIASWACLLIGGVFAVISAIGLIRMPDVFTRMHAASIGDSLALGFMVIGMILSVLAINTVKEGLVIDSSYLLDKGPLFAIALLKAISSRFLVTPSNVLWMRFL